MDFKLFGKTSLVVNKTLRLLLGHELNSGRKHAKSGHAPLTEFGIIGSDGLGKGFFRRGDEKIQKLNARPLATLPVLPGVDHCLWISWDPFLICSDFFHVDGDLENLSFWDGGV